jgi:hypothetical protein
MLEQLTELKTYFINVPQNKLDHWKAQEEHRSIFVKSGVTHGNIKWYSGTAGPGIRPYLTWRISCTDKQLFWILLKTSGQLVDK